MKRTTLPAVLLLLLGLANVAFCQSRAASVQGQPAASRLRSPDGRVEVAFALNRDGAPTYSVS
jgi:hypothetical protein